MITGTPPSTLILTAITIIGSICIGFMILLAGHWLAGVFYEPDEHENTDERMG